MSKDNLVARLRRHAGTWDAIFRLHRSFADSALISDLLEAAARIEALEARPASEGEGEERPCRRCGGSKRVHVPCPDDIDGCLVYHTGPCPDCAAILARPALK